MLATEYIQEASQYPFIYLQAIYIMKGHVNHMDAYFMRIACFANGADNAKAHGDNEVAGQACSHNMEAFSASLAFC